jgi:hypothetical protein
MALSLFKHTDEGRRKAIQLSGVSWGNLENFRVSPARKTGEQKQAEARKSEDSETVCTSLKSARFSARVFLDLDALRAYTN